MPVAEVLAVHPHGEGPHFCRASHGATIQWTVSAGLSAGRSFPDRARKGSLKIRPACHPPISQSVSQRSDSLAARTPALRLPVYPRRVSSSPACSFRKVSALGLEQPPNSTQSAQVQRRMQLGSPSSRVRFRCSRTAKAAKPARKIQRGPWRKNSLSGIAFISSP